MATLWIHRACGSDMLVRFSTGFDAYNFGTRFIREYYSEEFIESWDETKFSTSGNSEVGITPSLQLVVHGGEFHPDGWKGIDKWADRGTFIVSPEEAMALGEEGLNAQMKLESDILDNLKWEDDISELYEP